jgi:hypothetical protein
VVEYPIVKALRSSRLELRAHPVRVLIAIQLTAIVVFGVVTVAKFQLFAPVDEQAHFSYVQELAEHGRLPYMGRDYVSTQSDTLEFGAGSRRRPMLNWEAFQPPLYYAIAAPVFLIASNYRAKVFVLRAFDLILLLIGVAILARLARAVFAERWEVPFACALAVVLWPGLLVREVTVSDMALEIPIVALYVLCLWNATVRRDPKALIAAGGLMALCLLTQLTLLAVAPLLAVPLVAILRDPGARRDRRTLAAVAVAVALPLALLAPWVISNENRYGALTAGAIAKRVQGPVETAEFGTTKGFEAIRVRLWRLSRAALPSEWWNEFHKTPIGLPLEALVALLVAIPLLAVIREPRLLASTAAALLASPLVLGLLTICGIVLFAGWPSFQPRYVNPAMPLLALFGAWSSSRRGVRPAVAVSVAAAVTLLVGFVWLYMSGAYFFTHIGASIGIHPASG